MILRQMFGKHKLQTLQLSKTTLEKRWQKKKGKIKYNKINKLMLTYFCKAPNITLPVHRANIIENI